MKNSNIIRFDAEDDGLDYTIDDTDDWEKGVVPPDECDGEDECCSDDDSYVYSQMKKAAIANEEEEDELETNTGKKKKKETDFTQWRLFGENAYVPSGEIKRRKVVPPGVYKILYNRDWGNYLAKKEVSLDELFILPQPEQGLILNDIRTFWERKEAFKKYKYTYKRGILLYGSPGNGKSSIINLLSQEIVDQHKGIVFYLNTPDELQTFCNFIPTIFKQIEPDTPILCVLEDLETLTKHYETEILLLNTLDGANQMENIVFLGCTNFPEELKERIINRPSRFDRRYYIGPPTPEVRKIYFEKKLKQDDLEELGTEGLQKWVDATDGLSIAHLGELVKSVLCLGNTFEDVMKEFDKMKQKISSHSFGKDEKGIGFGYSRTSSSSDTKQTAYSGEQQTGEGKKAITDEDLNSIEKIEKAIKLGRLVPETKAGIKLCKVCNKIIQVKDWESHQELYH
jgi:DNA replication protein DnaC